MANIYQFPTPIPVTNGNNPQFRFAVFGDGLSTVTTAGYLNAASIEAGLPLSNADVIMALYSFNQQTRTGTFGIFTVSVATSTGQITLTQWIGAAGMQTNTANVMTSTGSITMNKVNGTEASNAVTANGVAGAITTSSLTTAGGSSYAITWTNSAITATSVVLLTIAGGTNTTENITLKCVPGAGSATLTIYNNTAATALNGTIIISYLVM